jgi:hypothetical protein
MLFAGLSSAIAVAQTDTPARPSQPAENPGSRAETGQGFDHWIHDNPQAAHELRQNPNLINNPTWMSQHQDLQNYMNSHPDFKAGMEKNPQATMERTHQEMMQHKNERQAHHQQNGHPQTTNAHPQQNHPHQ